MLTIQDKNVCRVGMLNRLRAGWRPAMLMILIWAFFLGQLAIFPIPVLGVDLSSRNSIPKPQDYFGHPLGADQRLVSWRDAAAYYQEIGRLSPRVAVREVGKTTLGRPFLLVQVSGEQTIANLDRFQSLQKRLYFQDHKPGRNPYTLHSKAQKEQLFGEGKAVVVITCSMHATEVGAAQMGPELVYRLASEDTPKVKAVLDNVILLLVANLNPDGQDLVSDWYQRYLGTPYEAGSMPWLYHAYTGHDNNRDAFMFTQQETRLLGEILYKEWFPCIWVDMHQQGSTGARMFVMPATDPININVHPLIYRLNGLFGHAQGAALEEQGKVGVIYNSTYTNFWEGAMGWMGWWHNQVGMLTEAASCRLASPTQQEKSVMGQPPAGPPPSREERRRIAAEGGPLPPPRDVLPRTEYPRPWLGGTWSLRDIVDYDHIAAMAVLETAAGIRRSLLEQIYHVNQTTIAAFLKGMNGGAEKKGYASLPGGIQNKAGQIGRVMPGSAGAGGTPYAVVIPEVQNDPPTVVKMLRILERGGVIVERARSSFTAADTEYPAGTYVIRLAQVFGRYAKDMLEPQTYPEVRRHPSLPPEPPYDVSGWSLGMQMGVDTVFIDEPFSASLELAAGSLPFKGALYGDGGVYLIDARLNDGFSVVNRIFENNAEVARGIEGFSASFSGQRGEKRFSPGSWIIRGIPREQVESLAHEFGLEIYAVAKAPQTDLMEVRKPRIGLYQPWQSNADEGWTRWVLEQYGFDYTVLHAQDLWAAGGASRKKYAIPDEERSQWPPHVARHAPPAVSESSLAERFDVIVFAHQEPESILRGTDASNIPPFYRAGIGLEGIRALNDFVNKGGSLVALGDATGLLIREWPLAVSNAVADVDAEDFLIPGSIVRIQTDPRHPLAWGMPAETTGYFRRNPVFRLTAGFRDQSVSIPVRYPNDRLRASGWVRGGKYIAGLPAIVQIDLSAGGGGRLVLLGLRVQNRAQTHGTFKILFNALLGATD